MTEDNIPKATSGFGSWQKPRRPIDDDMWDYTLQNSWKNFCKISTAERKSAKVQDELDDVTTCCICDETYRYPMILPCIHTFCLTCLQRIGTHNDKNPGDPMPCPLCRQEFTIPEDGFAALKKNFFMVRLIEITTTQQIDSNVCDKHKHENLVLYCSDCNDVLCLLCVREWHQNHRLSDLSSAADILHSQLQSNVSTAKQCMSDALKKKERLLQKRFAVCEKIKDVEAEVNQARHDLKALIDRHADSLFQNLGSLRKEQLEDIDLEEKELDKHLDCLKNFERCCAELTSNNRHDSLFYKMARKLKKQIVELKRLNESIIDEYDLLSLEIDLTKTEPTALDIYKTKNIIGVVKGNIDYSEKPELVTTIRTNIDAVNEFDSISGMAVSYNDVFIVHENNPVVSIYDSRTHKCTTQMTLEGLVREVDFRDCVSVAGKLYIVNQITREILRIDQNRNFMKWSTRNDSGRLSVSAESTLVATCYETGALKEYSLQGTLLYEIKLCLTIVHPLHAIKLGNGHFVVSHGSYNDAVNRVCMVNDWGEITKSFGDCWRGYSSKVLDVPTCLAVDENENILVLDRNNSRVLQLTRELEFEKELLTEADGLQRSVAMQLDEKTSQLYIADYWETFQRCDSRVLVFNVK